MPTHMAWWLFGLVLGLVLGVLGLLMAAGWVATREDRQRERAPTAEEAERAEDALIQNMIIVSVLEQLERHELGGQQAFALRNTPRYRRALQEVTLAKTTGEYERILRKYEHQS